MDLMVVTLVVLYIKRPVLLHLVELKSKETAGMILFLAFKIILFLAFRLRVIPPGPGSGSLI